MIRQKIRQLLGTNTDQQNSTAASAMSSPESKHRSPPYPALVTPKKAYDNEGRFREIISDPLNILIYRAPQSGCVVGNFVYLHNGLHVPLAGPHSYYEDLSRILIFNRGVHEPLEEYVFQEVLKRQPEAPKMLELGAYWSHYSMWMKYQRSEATCVMVEPDAWHLEVGKFNLSLNNLAGEFIQDFVGKGKFEVDHFLKSKNWSYLDVLHADIQHFEYEMLLGASSALAKRQIGHVFISTHRDELHRLTVETLINHGYRVEVSSDYEHETTSFDGFVYATSPEIEATFRYFRPLGRSAIANADPSALLASLNEVALNEPK